MKKNNSWWEALRFGIVLLAIIIPFRMFVAQPFIVHGASMDETFHQNDYLVVDELSYLWRDPRRGEVIVFKNPADPSQYFIKRVIGLPGETVRIRDGEVFISRSDQTFKLEEDYLGSLYPRNTQLTLKEGEYFVMGDNRSVSWDSRSWGALNRELIKGRAMFRLFPLKQDFYLPGQADYQNQTPE
ncbi:MAG: signal peptidase I [Candidatus Vogelbacteria bacterium CG10_big_fil_rev_8_21_14_0_10_49_38]|uniref:Signal peptidase I n=1 Tax=Candidatus Vogelbacteria bacterium CG10_big_fil_rev_8_21_14_0_10_49_38 TaxID=1975043 RepID=A0A2H0RGX1_9BACT|nr:MAG: signal peptidase I [bacterium CG10_49_38]PIR45758.1 MAG: signal peptidase I [Candidatus Vogelbacteria bacterium CG10_big_fil_rev_8_21_14_0_10_49_38]